jgi:hypothetical protein
MRSASNAVGLMFDAEAARPQVRGEVGCSSWDIRAPSVVHTRDDVFAVGSERVSLHA